MGEALGNTPDDGSKKENVSQIAKNEITNTERQLAIGRLETISQQVRQLNDILSLCNRQIREARERRKNMPDDESIRALLRQLSDLGATRDRLLVENKELRGRWDFGIREKPWIT